MANTIQTENDDMDTFHLLSEGEWFILHQQQWLERLTQMIYP